MNKTISTFAPSLARSQSSRPLRNLRLEPCLPIFVHFERRNLPNRDQWSAFKSRIRLRITSRDTPRKSCPTITSGSDLYMITKTELEDEARGKKLKLTQKTAQQHSFVLHRQNRSFRINFRLFLEIGGEFIKRANKGVDCAFEFLRRRWVVNLHYRDSFRIWGDERNGITYCHAKSWPKHRQFPFYSLDDSR